MVIELSKAQVDQIIRSAAGSGGFGLALYKGLETQEIETSLAVLEDPRFSRSLLAGLLMLAAFRRDGGYLGNADVAQLMGMNASTTHRYISTLVEVGLLERNPSTRRYRLAQ